MAMPLALKILRGNPSVTLQKFGLELGRATSAWYDERHLARTEEPDVVDGNGCATPSRACRDGRFAGVVPAQPQSSSTLSSAWKEIKRVSPGSIPGASKTAT